MFARTAASAPGAVSSARQTASANDPLERATDVGAWRQIPDAGDLTQERSRSDGCSAALRLSISSVGRGSGGLRRVNSSTQQFESSRIGRASQLWRRRLDTRTPSPGHSSHE
jgi:hypothetical protein